MIDILNRVRNKELQSKICTAEEAAATSEELSAQAENVEELVGRFNLRED